MAIKKMEFSVGLYGVSKGLFLLYCPIPKLDLIWNFGLNIKWILRVQHDISTF